MKYYINDQISLEYLQCTVQNWFIFQQKLLDLFCSWIFSLLAGRSPRIFTRIHRCVPPIPERIVCSVHLQWGIINDLSNENTQTPSITAVFLYFVTDLLISFAYPFAYQETIFQEFSSLLPPVLMFLYINEINTPE